MSKSQSRVFLERRTYRKRRLTDAARMLPLTGAFLWLLPTLWGFGVSGTKPTSSAVLYVFGVWAVLIVCSGILTRALGKASREDETGQR